MLTGLSHFGYFQIGGVQASIDESIFWRWTDYPGKVLNDDPVNPGMYQRINVISYTCTVGHGFSAIIGVEQGMDGDSDNQGENNYLPDSGQGIGRIQGRTSKAPPVCVHFTAAAR